MPDLFIPAALIATVLDHISLDIGQRLPHVLHRVSVPRNSFLVVHDLGHCRLESLVQILHLAGHGLDVPDVLGDSLLVVADLSEVFLQGLLVVRDFLSISLGLFMNLQLSQ